MILKQKTFFFFDKLKQKTLFIFMNDLKTKNWIIKKKGIKLNHYKIGCNHIFMWTRQHIPDKNKVIQVAYAKECVVKSFNLYISRKGKYKIWRKKKNPTISWLFQPTMIEFTTYITFFFSFFYFYSFWIKEILSSLTSAESLSPCCTGNYEEL